MDKTIYSHKQELGKEGAAEVSVGVKGQNLRLEGTVSYEKPVEEILTPVFKAADQFIDKLEQWIPGDQKAMAEKAKAELREAAVKGLLGAVPEQAPETPAPQVEAPAQA